METSIMALILTTVGVTLAEMGDKTQLLAMACAAKYKPKLVFIGISIAIVLLSLSAVLIGNIITRFHGIQIWIQGLAAISFVIFGIWTIREQEDNESTECKRSNINNPIITVMLAFFVAELGDKTQLTTMAFAAKFPDNPVAVFFGGVIGLIIANVIGIGLGDFISKKIRKDTMKFISAIVFFIFGFIGCYEVAVVMLNINVVIVSVCIGLAALILGTWVRYTIKRNK